MGMMLMLPTHSGDCQPVSFLPYCLFSGALACVFA